MVDSLQIPTHNTNSERDSHLLQKRKAFGQPGQADQASPAVEIFWMKMSPLTFQENHLIRIEDPL